MAGGRCYQRDDNKERCADLVYIDQEGLLIQGSVGGLTVF